MYREWACPVFSLFFPFENKFRNPVFLLRPSWFATTTLRPSVFPVETLFYWRVVFNLFNSCVEYSIARFLYSQSNASSKMDIPLPSSSLPFVLPLPLSRSSSLSSNINRLAGPSIDRGRRWKSCCNKVCCSTGIFDHCGMFCVVENVHVLKNVLMIKVCVHTETVWDKLWQRIKSCSVHRDDTYIREPGIGSGLHSWVCWAVLCQVWYLCQSSGISSGCL